MKETAYSFIPLTFLINIHLYYRNPNVPSFKYLHAICRSFILCYILNQCNIYKIFVQRLDTYNDILTLQILATRCFFLYGPRIETNHRYTIMHGQLWILCILVLLTNILNMRGKFMCFNINIQCLRLKCLFKKELFCMLLDYLNYLYI